ncbi:MAG: hypothetical protein ACW98F_05005 [Candidatus Hodarchaeales archaeon]|jgi:hypothetical protein
MSTKPKNFKKQYQKLLSSLNEARSDENLSYELSSEVYVSEWINIFLSGNIVSKEVEIQIEILIPILSTQESNSVISKRPEDSQMGFILTTQIKHLEYLLGLHKENEFELDIIKEEGIWFGTKKLKTEPTEKLISRIMPPIISPEEFSN